MAASISSPVLVNVVPPSPQDRKRGFTFSPSSPSLTASHTPNTQVPLSPNASASLPRSPSAGSVPLRSPASMMKSRFTLPPPIPLLSMGETHPSTRNLLTINYDVQRPRSNSQSATPAGAAHSPNHHELDELDGSAPVADPLAANPATQHVPLSDPDLTFQDANAVKRCWRSLSSLVDRISANKQMMAFAAWAVLICSVFGIGTVGPTFLYIRSLGVPPILAASWRCQCIVLLMIPLVAWELHRTTAAERRMWVIGRSPQFPDKPHVLWYMLGVSVFWAFALCMTVTSLRWTSTVRASLFGCCYPLILLVYFRFTGVRISSGEVLGVLIGFLGIFITVAPSLFTSSASSSSEETVSSGEDPLTASTAAPNYDRVTGKEWLGDLMNLGASFGIAVNVMLARHARTIVPLMTYTTVLTTWVSIYLGIASLAIEGTNMSTAVKGMFGWTSSELIGVMIAFALVVGYVGLIGFNFAVKTMDPMLFSTMQLLNPVFAGFISWIWGLEGVPSVETFLGGFAVLGGIGLVTVFESKRRKQTEAEAARMSAESADLDQEADSTTAAISVDQPVEPCAETDTSDPTQTPTPLSMSSDTRALLPDEPLADEQLEQHSSVLAAARKYRFEDPHD